MNALIASQIADLLNKHNELVIDYDANRILKNSDTYIFNLDESNNVVSVIECKKVQWYQFEVCHLTVDPKYRGKGEGAKILDKAINKAKDNGARVIQCTIREGNSASESLFSKSDFIKTNTFYYPTSKNNVGVWQKVVSRAT